MSRYLNPYTDFGFKKLFGEEANKDLLIDFLNTLLPQKHQIEKLTFRNPEVLGVAASDRRAVFDIYCENAKGEPFIVEMQKAEQEFFKDRSVYYTAHPVREQGVKGSRWNFEQKSVYFIGILDFVYDQGSEDAVLIREVSLKDQHGDEFYDKLKLIYIQMPLFDKTPTQLETRQDKWLYFLKHLPSLEHIPTILKEKVFQKAFHTAELAAMNKNERANYEQDLNDYWTYLASMETAEKKGFVNGFEKGEASGFEKGEDKKAHEIARTMKNDGLDLDFIVKYTGLSIEEINELD